MVRGEGYGEGIYVNFWFWVFLLESIGECCMCWNELVICEIVGGFGMCMYRFFCYFVESILGLIYFFEFYRCKGCL